MSNAKNKKNMSPERLKYIELLYSTVTRMNANSFQIKGYMMLILTSSLIATTTTKESWILAATLVVTVIFWIWDSTFIRTERQFREVIKEVAEQTDDSELFIPNLDKHNKSRCTFPSSMFISFNCFFYFALLAFISIVGYCIKFSFIL